MPFPTVLLHVHKSGGTALVASLHAQGNKLPNDKDGMPEQPFPQSSNVSESVVQWLEQHTQYDFVALEWRCCPLPLQVAPTLCVWRDPIERHVSNWNFTYQCHPDWDREGFCDWLTTSRGHRHDIYFYHWNVYASFVMQRAIGDTMDQFDADELIHRVSAIDWCPILGRPETWPDHVPHPQRRVNVTLSKRQPSEEDMAKLKRETRVDQLLYQWVCRGRKETEKRVLKYQLLNPKRWLLSVAS